MTMVGELPPISTSATRNNTSKADGESRKSTRNSFDEGWRCKLPKLVESDRTISEPLLCHHELANFPPSNVKSRREKLGRSLAQRLGTILAKTKNHRPTMIKKGSNYSKLGPIQKQNNNKPVKYKPASRKMDEREPKDHVVKSTEQFLFEEPFSIRQKIEQFRKWHEEQATSRISKLSPENRDSIKSKSDIRKESICSKKPVYSLAEERLQYRKMTNNGDTTTKRMESPPAKVDLSEIERISSARTWRTWRDVNESYAYSDVKTYIKENKLLPPDKESWIVNWVRDVHITTGIPEET